MWLYIEMLLHSKVLAGRNNNAHAMVVTRE
jgi:hypothetical protein